MHSVRVAAMVLLECWRPYAGAALISLSLMAPQTHGAPQAQEFKCSPADVSRRGTLTLEWRMPHPVEMAVIRPDKEFFFIAQRRLSSSQSKSMPAEVFAGIQSMQIIPALFQAQRWRAGAPDLESVFAMPGRYRFLVGNNLESERDASTLSCEINLKD